MEKKAEIFITEEAKLILISEGKLREINVPFHGEVVVKSIHGKIKKFDVVRGELF